MLGGAYNRQSLDLAEAWLAQSDATTGAELWYMLLKKLKAD